MRVPGPQHPAARESSDSLVAASRGRDSIEVPIVSEAPVTPVLRAQMYRKTIEVPIVSEQIRTDELFFDLHVIKRWRP